MREIKFRCWSKKEGMSYTPISINFNTDGHINGNAVFGTFPVKIVGGNDLVWMQFTGLRDKNGKEIYEFDQLKGDWDVVNDIYLGTVEFYGGAFRIKETGLPLAWADKYKDCEVVGNKFETSELLKGAK